MKRILFIAVILGLYFLSNGNTSNIVFKKDVSVDTFINKQTIGSATTLFVSKGGLRGDSALILPFQFLSDTTAANFTRAAGYMGSLIRIGNSMWIRGSSLGNTTPNRWYQLATVGSTGTVTSISQGFGITASPNPITTIGTITSDTTVIVSKSYFNNFNALNVKYADTSAMLTPYLRKSDTLTMLNPYLRKSDTSNMLDPYVRKTILINTNAPLAGGGSLANNLTLVADTGRATGQLSTGGSLNKVKDSLVSLISMSGGGTVLSVSTNDGFGVNSSVTDPTANPIINIAVDTIQIATRYTTDSIAALKLNISDTSAMLGNYLRKTDTLTMLSPYLRKTDTLTMLSPYLRKTDTLTMLTPYKTYFPRLALSFVSGFGNYNSSTGVITIPTSTSDVSEGSNLYFLDGRARAAISAGTGISYNASTGVITNSAPSLGGTVTSVALSAPAFLSVSGSPITTSGTLTLGLSNQSANLVFASPTTGSAAQPTFRSLVVADIPDLSSLYPTVNIFSDSISAIRTLANSKYTGGTVTSIATNNGSGITGGTITATGTLSIDTLNISTRLWRQKGIDSVMGQVALKLNISDTSTMLSNYLRKSDTVTMLSPYLRKGDTSAMLNGNYLRLTGGTLTGALNGTTGTFNGAITAGGNSANIVSKESTSGTQANYISFRNSVNSERAYVGYGSSSDENFSVYQGLNANLDFYSNQLLRGRFVSAGRFLLNTTTDDGSSILQVNGNALINASGTANLRIKGNSTTGFDIQNDNTGAYLTNRDATPLFFLTNGIERLNISGSGVSTFSGNTLINGTLGVSGLVSLTRGNSGVVVLTAQSATTSAQAININNTSGRIYMGVESSTGNSEVTNAPAYSAFVSSIGSNPLVLAANNTVAQTIASSGTTTFVSTVTATRFIANSGSNNGVDVIQSGGGSILSNLYRAEAKIQNGTTTIDATATTWISNDANNYTWTLPNTSSLAGGIYLFCKQNAAGTITLSGTIIDKTGTSVATYALTGASGMQMVYYNGSSWFVVN